MKKIVAFLALFSSTSTLFCCALPALFVALGSGAVFAGLITRFPALVFLSEHKVFLFSASGSLLIASYVLQTRASRLSCPTDPLLAENCKTTRSWSKPVFYLSALVYTVGSFFAFLAPLLFD